MLEIPESFGGDNKEIASSSFPSSSRREASVIRASTSSCSISRAETKSCLASKEYEYFTAEQSGSNDREYCFTVTGSKCTSVTIQV